TCSPASETSFLSASFTKSIAGSCSAGTSTSSGGLTGGKLGSSGSVGGSSGSYPGGVPVDVAMFLTMSLSISACVTVYTAEPVVDSPGFNVVVSNSTSIPTFSNIASCTFTSFNVKFPMFVTTKLYVIVSPAFTTLSLSAVFSIAISGVLITGTSSSDGGVFGLFGSSGSPPGGVPVAVAILTILSSLSISS